MNDNRILNDAELDAVRGAGHGVAQKKDGNDGCQLINLPFGLTIEMDWGTGHANWVESSANLTSC